MPIVSNSVRPSGKIFRRSMAPRAARMPCLTPLPSKAGPAEAEQQTIHSLFPSTTSPLVPMST